MGMDQKPHTLWDRMAFEDGGRERERERTLVVLRFSIQDMLLLFIGLFGELHVGVKSFLRAFGSLEVHTLVTSQRLHVKVACYHNVRL